MPENGYNLDLLPTVFVDDLKRTTDHSKDKEFMDCGMFIPRVCFFTGMPVRIFSAIHNQETGAYTLVADAFYFNQNKYRTWCENDLGTNSEFLSKIPIVEFDCNSDKETVEKFKRKGGCYGFVQHERYTIEAEEGCSTDYRDVKTSTTPETMRTHFGRQDRKQDYLNLANVTWYDDKGQPFGHFVPIWYDQMTTEKKVMERLHVLLETMVQCPARECGRCPD